MLRGKILRAFHHLCYEESQGEGHHAEDKQIRCENAKEKGIDLIVMGHNEGWKQNANIGHMNNRQFV